MLIKLLATRVWILGWIFVVCLVMPARSPAAVYYVAVEVTGASDSNNGLAAERGSGNSGPWRSCAKAASAARAGDTVYVLNGDYRGQDQIVPESSGTASAPIRFIVPSGHQAIVASFLVSHKQWIEIEGFTIVNPHYRLPDRWKDMPALVVDQVGIVINPGESWSTRQGKVQRKYSTYVSIYKALSDNWSSGIDIEASAQIVVRNNDISLFTTAIEIRDQSSGITVENNEIHHCRNAVFTWRPAPSVTDAVIRGNHFYQIFDEGINLLESAQRVLIENNLGEYNATSHIAVHGGSSACTVRGNVVRYGGYYTEAMEYPGSSAINFHKAGPNNIADGNLAAYQLDPTLYDGNGFIVDLMHGIAVILRNNIAYRNMGSGITTTDSANCVIVNNALIENGFNSTDEHNSAGVRLARRADTGHVIVNNIFYRNKAAGIQTFDRIDRQVLVDFNLYFQPGTALIWDGWTVSDGLYPSLSQIHKHTIWEKHGLEADPQFMSESNLDFRLQSTSPAISAASSSYAPPADYQGRNRDPEPDIGPIEHAGGRDGTGSIDLLPPRTRDRGLRAPQGQVK